MVEVEEAKQKDFERAMKGISFGLIGCVSAGDDFKGLRLRRKSLRERGYQLFKRGLAEAVKMVSVGMIAPPRSAELVPKTALRPTLYVHLL